MFQKGAQWEKIFLNKNNRIKDVDFFQKSFASEGGFCQEIKALTVKERKE